MKLTYSCLPVPSMMERRLKISVDGGTGLIQLSRYVQ